jgi:hypothetical protein
MDISTIIVVPVVQPRVAFGQAASSNPLDGRVGHEG